MPEVTELEEGLREKPGLEALNRQMSCFVQGSSLGPGPSDRYGAICRAVCCWGVGNGSQASLGPGWPVRLLAVTLSCLPQDIITALEERLKPLVQAELSVLVDVLHWPELLFLEGSEAYQRCESGGFLSK